MTEHDELRNDLPYIPRPLVIWAHVAGNVVPCVQWHGKDTSGNVTKEQYLFPIYGTDTEWLELSRDDLWRVLFLGDVSEWNELHPDNKVGLYKNGDIESGYTSIIRIYSNDLFRSVSPVLNCCVVYRSEEGLLLAPDVYYNNDLEKELPRYDADEGIQKRWRDLYKKHGWESGLSLHLDGLLNHEGLFLHVACEHLRRKTEAQEEYRWG